MARVIGMALAVLPERRRSSIAPNTLASSAKGDAEPAHAPARASDSIGPGPTAQQLLTQALEKLEPEMALKLRTLMVAGRDGRSVSAVQLNMTLADADSAFAAAARDSSENGPLLADYLRRGHAMACAAGLDIERPISDWPSVAPQSLEERAWQSFGRQLATSQPEDWKCVGFVASNHAEQLTKLYLKLEDRAWWSFQSLLDRPSASSVDKQKKARKGARAKAVATGSLKLMVNRGSGNEGRALRRAVRAIRARLGDLEGAA